MVNVKNIISKSSIPQSSFDYKYYHEYVINYDDNKNKKVIDVPVKNIYGTRNTFSKKIVSSNKFINGFKLVILEDNTFGYIRESDNVMVPYRYDIASDFNEYGLAMVGKYGFVTWIDKDFNYLSNEGYVKGKMAEETGPFIGFNAVFEFDNKGISRVCEIDYSKISTPSIMTDKDKFYTSFFTKDKEILKFKEYGSPIETTKTKFSGNSVVKIDCADLDEEYVFMQGYYINKEDISFDIKYLSELRKLVIDKKIDDLNKEWINLQNKVSFTGNFISNYKGIGPLTKKDSIYLNKIKKLKLEIERMSD